VLGRSDSGSQHRRGALAAVAAFETIAPPQTGCKEARLGYTCQMQ
jgi:hypothetical protein